MFRAFPLDSVFFNEHRKVLFKTFPIQKEAGQKSKTPAACQSPKSLLPKIPLRMVMEGPVCFQYHLLVSKKRIAHFRSDSNSKIKICGAFLPKSGSEQHNPCYLPNFQVYWTLDCTFSVANDSNALCAFCKVRCHCIFL